MRPYAITAELKRSFTMKRYLTLHEVVHELDITVSIPSAVFIALYTTPLFPGIQSAISALSGGHQCDLKHSLGTTQMTEEIISQLVSGTHRALETQKKLEGILDNIQRNVKLEGTLDIRQMTATSIL